MTIRGAMADDMDGLQCAWTMCFIAPTRDQNGRAVLCCDRCMIDPKKFGRDRLVCEFIVAAAAAAASMDFSLFLAITYSFHTYTHGHSSALFFILPLLHPTIH